ncbi:MAG TPA: hypothetical protein VF669_10150 [Tepidisphaeraceae bacterium]|jgi:hypothetical protein
MALKIVCSGLLIRHPVGGHSWHHLQYLLGLERLGCEVTFFEDFGWAGSCFDASRDEMTGDPSFGIGYMEEVWKRAGYRGKWCYLREDGRAHGMTREELAQALRECDVYLNLSNINWIDEVKLARRRGLVDTDPVFTQIGGHGAGGTWSDYDVLFTYGENVHRPGCEMPTGGQRWVPTRQPVVTELWPVKEAAADAPMTTLVNWSAYGDRTFEGRTYGQKDREFANFFSLPREAGVAMELALSGPDEVKTKFENGGWRVADPMAVSKDPWTYQDYIARSKGEFCVAKHGYVSTRCGWFSDRSSAYLAMGKPVVLQDTGFSENLPVGEGLLAFDTSEQAVAAVKRVGENYAAHSAAARRIAEDFFDYRKVLELMLEKCV